ncbi:hypothetical protein V5799_003151 [Amblyomma americanum]|uniref:Fibronectin type-III domain-containing protein n=1 Tax=Amblyomma americanum TaxID=6943 RepID=A0AAQ4D9T2_AMBAM
MTLHHLRPDTWYSLRVTAHTEAGPAVAEYTIRTLPASATLAENHTVGGGRCASSDALAESALVKRSSLDNVLSTLTSASGRQSSSYLASPARHSVVAPAATPTQGSIDDISGYAQFPETQVKSSNSRVVLKKTQEQPVANTRIKRPFSIQKLASNDGE